jgi:Rrf2 family protein
MKLITRDTDYALRALCAIAEYKEKKVSVSELNYRLKIPRAFLRKILQHLQKKGVLDSSRGSGGGFLLVKPIDKIFLVDLIEIFQGPLQLNECFFKKMACPNTRSCTLKKKVDRIEKYVINQLKSINLASLLR